MTNIDIKRVCIHECCHAVVARLFRQTITIEELVVNAHLVKKGQDIGTLSVKGPLLDDEQDYTALAITLFAGVVGENMYLLGTDAIRERKGEIIADNTIMDWLFAGGDISLFLNNAYVFRLCYQIDEVKLKGFCLRFLIDFLSNKEVWSMVEKLCDELLKADDLKLSEEELESVFRRIGLDALLDNKRKEYLKQCNEVLQFCYRSEPCL
ncbi:MAG: hypothetical protein WCF67_07420 [Chitinophagaceae bacterium]